MEKRQILHTLIWIVYGASIFVFAVCGVSFVTWQLYSATTDLSAGESNEYAGTITSVLTVTGVSMLGACIASCVLGCATGAPNVLELGGCGDDMFVWSAVAASVDDIEMGRVADDDSNAQASLQ